MKKLLLLIAAILAAAALTFSVLWMTRQEPAAEIDLDALNAFLQQRPYENAVYNKELSEKFSPVIYIVENRGFGRERLESPRQVSSQRVLVYELSDQTAIYLVLGKIMGGVSVPADTVISFSPTLSFDDGTPVCNTVFTFYDILISGTAVNPGGTFDEVSFWSFCAELRDHLSEYLSQQQL